MSPGMLALLFFGITVVLIVFELALPTHGLLAVAAGITCCVGIAFCFIINRWLGTGVLAGIVFASPLLFAAGVAAWQRTPLGKRVILSNVSPEISGAMLCPGTVGVAVSELRPMGECEFEGKRVQATSEIGLIRAGQAVRIVEISSGLARVRPVVSI